MIVKMATAFIGLYLFFGLCLGYVAGQSCTGRDWFGPSCHFQCHCLDSCDMTTGECIGDRGCDMGYFGPSCQYYSVAFKGTASQISGERNPSFAVDGYDTTCSATRPVYNPTWRVTFSDPAWVVWTDILFPNNEGTDEIDVFVVYGNETPHICNASMAWITSTLLRVTCKEAYNATTLIILSTSSVQVRLQLCEVYVSGGRNLAIHKRTNQSSEYLTGLYNSSLAVDGDTSTDFTRRSCTHTNDNGVNCPSNTGTKEPWWRLYLDGNYLLYRIMVYNREPNFDRLDDFRLRIGKSQTGSYSAVYRDRSKPAKEVTSVQMPANQTGYRLEVRLRGECRILTLCEVQVFGDCLDLRYGLECNSICSCRDPSEVCNKVDGRCLSGCADGITGIDCKQECPPGTFGRACARTCSENCMNRLCSNVDGTCNCKPGWKGDNCTIPCDLGTYGQECRERCDNCRERMCFSVNGICKQGCERGWRDSKCATACNATTFGWNCNETCTANCLGQRCNGATGACLACPEGKDGELCNKEKTGQSPMMMIVIAVVVIVLIVIAVVVVIVVLRRRRKRGPPPDVVPLKDTVAYDSGDDKVRVYENVAVTVPPADNESDVTEDLNNGHVDMTMDTDLDDNNMTLDRAKLIIDDSARKHDQVAEEEESHALDVTDLPSHMVTWRENPDYLLAEFKSLPRDLQDDIPHTVGMREENRKKNRYKNICAYDHSRVKLSHIDGDPNTDYINASHVKGYTKHEDFVASQGPTKKMMEDFIRMLWELRAPIVVMLTNVVEEGKRKCEQYWDDADEMDAGDFTIDVVNCKEYAHYTIRTLQISEVETPDSSRRLTQYHFTSWPDKSVPASPWSLINFRNKVMTPERDQGPVVVHCSAGVGRTGTFIGLDYLMRMADEVGHVDIYDCVERMRKARVNMVQTMDQYILLHEALTLSMLLPPPIESHWFLSRQDLDDAALTTEYMRLGSFVGQDSVKFRTGTIKKSESMTSIADDAASQASLPREGLDYEGSVFIPSYHHYKEYLLMDSPDVAHTEEFYRWMFDLDIRTMVTLDHPNPDIWPEEGETLEFSRSSVSCTRTETRGVAVIRTLVYQEQGLAHELHQLMCPDWVDSTNLCDTPQLLLDFIATVKQTTSQRPVVLQSSPSYGNGGIFCCVAGIVEMVEEEQKVAVPHVVSQIRACKTEVIRSLAEYKLCYDCVARHLDTEHIYSNYNATS